ncbi:MAG: GntR family transcriptional regulator, partial [Marinobacterium sp.]
MSHSQRHGISSLSFSLQPDQGPYYQQLIDQILQAIAAGQLSPGDRLPGSRTLAQALG